MSDPVLGTVAVTGAAGFLGCRLVEYLSLGRERRVRALVRNFGSPGLARLARVPVEIVAADLENRESVLPAIRGCQAVVHCAHGSVAVNVDGTRHVLEAAREAGVDRLIHISTAVVHGTPHKRTVSETDPYRAARRPYADSKIEAERLVWNDYRRSRLPVTVLRPTRIFGPAAESFTIEIVKGIRAGAVTLVEGGTARANVVYVDNVVQAIMLCLDDPRAVGEAFIINNDEPVTWRDYCAAYASVMTDAAPLFSATLQELATERRRRRQAERTARIARALRVFRSGIGRVYWRYPGVRRLADAIVPQRSRSGRGGSDAPPEQTAKSRPGIAGRQLPDPWRAQGFASDTWYSPDKITRALGYRQKTSLAEGLELTAQWLRWARLA